MQSVYTFKHIEPKNKRNQNPAIFLFHGLGSNEEDLLQIVGEIQEVCHVFSLRGPITHDPGYAFYTFEEEGKPSQHIFDKVVAVTRDFILQAIDEYRLDPKKIFVAGFNQGAVIAQTLCVVMGNKIKGCAALSGYLPDFVKEQYYRHNMDETSVFISHGEYDYDYPIAWSRESKDFFEKNGAKVIYKTYPVGHGVSTENMHDFIHFILEEINE
ncbi:esterase [Ureibacillus sp. FSL K6-8385]|uniref:Esterase n=1 Tax=Ureibacillus terrenus TaxID=118246 RepID=A0A540V6D9_9BACL|nr:esterase [Ureibacillus terrenus]MED3660709.1 esterase [Ureibacillus terrenus]MED3762895.1 esterase [Ureibacillus terrenus]TQE92302.1 esterase [Ureibacillus terrenus]